MFFLVSFVLLAIFLYLLAIYLADFIATRIMSKSCKIVKGKLPFQYSKIEFKNNVSVTDLSIVINPFGLFTGRITFFRASVGNLDIDLTDFKVEKHEKRERSHLENIVLSFNITVLVWLVKTVELSIRKLNFKMKDITAQVTEFNVGYTRDGGTIYYKYAFGRSKIRYNDMNTLNIDPISHSSSAEIDGLLALINFDSPVILFKFTFEPIIFSTLGYDVSTPSFAAKIRFLKGEYSLNLPSFKFKAESECPNLSLYIQDLHGFVSIPKISIPELHLDIKNFSCRKLLLKCDDKEFIKISRVSLDYNKNWKFIVHRLAVYYRSSIGLEVVPFIMKFYRPIQLKNAYKHIDVKFPDLHADLRHLRIKLKMTDSATISINSDSITMRGTTIAIPAANMNWNETKVVSAKQVQLTSDDGKLKIHITKANYHDRNLFRIEKFLAEAIFGWKAIAPYIQTNLEDNETIPFPIVVSANTVRMKFHDSSLSSHLSRAVRLMPLNLNDAAIRNNLFDNKIQDFSFSKESIESGRAKLTKISFDEYKAAVEQEKLYKFKLLVELSNLYLSFDCTGFTEKVAFLHQVDPITKDLYPNMKWETLIGANLELKVGDVVAHAFDLEEPIACVNGIKVRGPIVLAEPLNATPGFVSFLIDGQKVTAKKNPCDLRLFGDVNANVEYFIVTFGQAFMRMYQQISNIFSDMIPSYPDPSPRLKWWDTLRIQLRGNYHLSCSKMIVRLWGSNQIHENDFADIQMMNMNVFSRLGNLKFASDLVNGIRYNKGKVGPTIFEFPHVKSNIKYSWETSGDARMHLVMPDTVTFNHPETCDSFSEFRSTKLAVDLVLDFQRTHSIIPNLTVDVAHLEWALKPLILAVNSPPVYNEVKHIYGEKIDPVLKVNSITDLLIDFKMNIFSSGFDIRIFDHYPIISGNIRGSSIDLQFDDIVIKTHMVMQRNQETPPISFKISGSTITLNATDISHFTKQKEIRSPTFLFINSIEAEYNEKRKSFEIDSINFYIHQILVKYLADHYGATSALINMFSQKNDKPKEQKVETENPFDQFFATLKINEIKINISSLETDYLALIAMNDLEASMNLNCKNNLQIDSMLKQFTIASNGAKPNIEDSKFLMVMNESKLIIDSKRMFFEPKTIELCMTPADFSSFRFVLAECFTSTEKKSKIDGKKVTNVGLTFSLQIKVPTLLVELEDHENKKIGKFDGYEAEISLIFNDDQSKIFNLSMNHLSATNPVCGSNFPNVLQRLPSQSEKAKWPHIRIQLKTLESVSDYIVLQQVELNLEPTNICFEYSFYETIFAFFNHSLKKRPYDMSKQIAMHTGRLGFVSYSEDQVPFVLEKDQLSKSAEYDIQSASEEIPIMIRYFRINPIAMKVSFKNQKLEVNDFESQLHEITYHDVSCPISQIFVKIEKDIEHDVIPQFLKHVVGIKAPIPELELTNLNEWINEEDEEFSKVDKIRFLLFGSERTMKKRESIQKRE